MMKYCQLKPSAALAAYVEFYWILEDPSPGGSVQRIIPDGRAGIILNFANPFESYANGVWKSQPECFLVGQITAPLLLRPSGPAAMLGIQFRPHGVAKLLGLPMRELTNSAVALDDLSRRLFRRLEWVRALSTPAEGAAAVDAILYRLAEKAGEENDPVSYAVGEIERTAGLIRVGDVARRTGWGARQLQRRFKDAVGISPKLFGRMQRFQGILQAMEGPASDWAGAALSCGYYDQAHLIRDFREFAGRTPTALLDEEIDLTRYFVQHRAMSHFSKTPAAKPR